MASKETRETTEQVLQEEGSWAGCVSWASISPTPTPQTAHALVTESTVFREKKGGGVGREGHLSPSHILREG